MFLFLVGFCQFQVLVEHNIKPEVGVASFFKRVKDEYWSQLEICTGWSFFFSCLRDYFYLTLPAIFSSEFNLIKFPKCKQTPMTLIVQLFRNAALYVNKHGPFYLSSVSGNFFVVFASHRY